MKKTLLTLATAAMASFTMMAAPASFPSSPAEGVIDLGINEEGISSININVNGVINRDAEGYATLSKDGVVLKSIPASNERMYYTFSGFDKTEEGNVHITFFSNQATTPAKEPGRYTVTIPSGFFTVAGTNNPLLTYNFMINAESGVTPEFTPAANSVVSELKEFTVTFPGAESLSFTDNSTTGAQGEYAAYLDIMFGGSSDGETANMKNLSKSVTISGNTATFTLPEALTGDGDAFFCLKAGCLTAKYADGTSKKNNTARIKYTVEKQAIDLGGFSITPAVGEVPAFTATDYSAEAGDGVYGYFKLNLPEGVTYAMLISVKGTLSDANGNKVASFTGVQNNAKNAAIFGVVTYPGGKKTFGKETLELPAGSYTLEISGKYYANGKQIDLPKTFGPFVLKSNDAAVKYTISPAEDEALNELKEITVTFEEDKTVTLKPNTYATIINGTIEYDIHPVAAGNKLTITLPKALDIPGEYKVTLPAQEVMLNGNPIPAIIATYKIDQAYVKNLEVTANNGGEVASCVFIASDENYDNYWKVSASFKEGTVPSLTFVIPSGYAQFAYMNATQQGGEEGTTIRRIASSELTAGGFTVNNTGVVDNLYDGENQMMISFGANDSFVNPTMVLVSIDFETGVEAIEASETAEYYTLQGVKVANPEKGIYIKVAGGKAVKVIL